MRESESSPLYSKLTACRFGLKLWQRSKRAISVWVAKVISALIWIFSFSSNLSPVFSKAGMTIAPAQNQQTRLPSPETSGMQYATKQGDLEF